ncbi:unnamed protein product [Closterium sp. Naga37s-1]|nr:unnamed protein product [Closterium sp. Naga37s-1]
MSYGAFFIQPPLPPFLLSRPHQQQVKEGGAITDSKGPRRTSSQPVSYHGPSSPPPHCSPSCPHRPPPSPIPPPPLISHKSRREVPSLIAKALIAHDPSLIQSTRRRKPGEKGEPREGGEEGEEEEVEEREEVGGEGGAGEKRGAPQSGPAAAVDADSIKADSIRALAGKRIQFLGLPEDGMGRKRSERRRRGSASGFDEILKDMEDGEKRAGGEEEEEETKVEEGETEDEAGAGGEEERVGDEEGEEGEEEEGEDEKEEAESSEDEDNVLLSKRPKALIGSAAAAAAAAAAARVRRGRRALESSQEEAESSEDEENVLLSKRQRALAAAAKVRRGQRSDRRQRGGGAARGGEMPREQEAQEEEWATGSQAAGGDGAMNLEGDQGAIVVPNSTAIAAGPVTGSALIGGATIASAAVGVEEKVELKEEAVREGVQLVLADDSFDGAEAIQWLQSRLKAAHASWTDAIARNSWQLLLMDGPDWPGRKGKKKGGKGKENGKKGKRRRGQEEEEEEEEGEGGEKEGDGGWGEVVHVDLSLVEELEDWDTVANDSMAQLLSGELSVAVSTLTRLMGAGESLETGARSGCWTLSACLHACCTREAHMLNSIPLCSVSSHPPALCLKHPDEADGCWRVPGDRGTQWLLHAVSMLSRMMAGESSCEYAGGRLQMVIVEERGGGGKGREGSEGREGGEEREGEGAREGGEERGGEGEEGGWEDGEEEGKGREGREKGEGGREDGEGEGMVIRACLGPRHKKRRGTGETGEVQQQGLNVHGGSEGEGNECGAGAAERERAQSAREKERWQGRMGGGGEFSEGEGIVLTARVKDVEGGVKGRVEQSIPLEEGGLEETGIRDDQGEGLEGDGRRDDEGSERLEKNESKETHAVSKEGVSSGEAQPLMPAVLGARSKRPASLAGGLDRAKRLRFAGLEEAREER